MAAILPVEDRRMMLVIHNLSNEAEDPGILQAFLQASLPGAPPMNVRILRKPPQHLYAFVTFPTVEDRDNALAVLDGVQMDGHALAVEVAERADPEKNVYISRIPEWVGIEEVLNLASNFGTVNAYNARPPNPRFPGALAMLVQMRTREEANALVANAHGIPKIHEEREYRLSAEFHAPRNPGVGE